MFEKQRDAVGAIQAVITGLLPGWSTVEAIAVVVTALFALPHQAGGFRLAKSGAFGIALAVAGAALLRDPLTQCECRYDTGSMGSC